MSRFLPALLAALLLAGCSTYRAPVRPATQTPTVNPGSDRYAQQQDSAPASPRNIDQLQEPVPHAEPLSRYGNPDSYVVNGQTYYVLKSAKNYDKTGTASWYGNKFHGYRTSSGEPYDMYQFTAANKELPLPSWARVTNLDNGKSVIVRVNDRGPFHEGRIVDLSWAAATRLGITAKGTGRVRVQSIVPGDNTAEAAAQVVALTDVAGKPAAVTDTGAPLFLQLGAFRDVTAASELQGRVQGIAGLPAARIQKQDDLYKLWVGPFTSEAQRSQARASLLHSGFDSMPVSGP